MMATLLNRSFRVIPGWSLARFHYRPVPVVYSRLEKPMTTPQMTSIMSDKVIIAMEPLSRKLSTSLVDGLQVKDESTASSSRSNDAPILQAKVIEKPTLKVSLFHLISFH